MTSTQSMPQDVVTARIDALAGLVKALFSQLGGTHPPQVLSDLLSGAIHTMAPIIFAQGNLCTAISPLSSGPIPIALGSGCGARGSGRIPAGPDVHNPGEVMPLSAGEDGLQEFLDCEEGDLCSGVLYADVPPSSSNHIPIALGSISSPGGQETMRTCRHHLRATFPSLMGRETVLASRRCQ